MRVPISSGVSASVRPALAAVLFSSVAGLALALAPGMASAQTGQERTSTVTEVVVTASKDEPESPKYTAPLLDTPQTITVVSSAVIEAQNLLTLRDILSTVPGITFGAGEGGGGYGDSINLRGFAASSDITTDGVRDSAQYTRSDPFNLEQIEVTNGANGAMSGSGSVGGSINLASKAPKMSDSTLVAVGVGTDNYGRLTLDGNRTLGDDVAIRLNAMVHQNDAPGRDVEYFRRWGFAPSIALGLGSPTQFTFSYLRQQDENIPQYGVPYYRNAFHSGPLPGVDPVSYFGYANVDKEESAVNSFTGRLDHRFSDTLLLRSLTRYQTVDRLIVVNPPQGTWCLAGGTNASTGAVCAPVDTYTLSGPRGNLRDSENTTLHHQTDLQAQFKTGAVSHNLAVGISATEETFLLDTGRVLRNPGAVTPDPVLPTMTISNPNNIYTGPINYIRASIQNGQRRNQSFYAFDTLSFSDQFEINGCLRYDHNVGVNSTDAYSTTPGATLGAVTPGAKFRSNENLVSYRVGLVYKPVSNASVYLAYGNSQTPSQSAVNGSCSATTCNVDPEEARNMEIGAKWNAMDGRLSLTAAAFRNERTNYKVASNDPADPDQVLDGQSRVDGVSLGVAGQIDDHWAVFANYTFLDSEVVRGKSKFCVANPAAAGCPSAAADPTGRSLTNTPEHAGSLWVTYNFANRVQVGYGLTYSGSFLLSNTIATAYYAPSYTVSRLMLNWPINQKTELRLNINNVFDKEYYTRIRNNGWATPGDTRNATLSLNYRF